MAYRNNGRVCAFNIKADQKLHDEFKSICIARSMLMQDVLHDIVQVFVEKHTKTSNSKAINSLINDYVNLRTSSRKVKNV